MKLIFIFRPNGLTFAVPLREDIELAFGDMVTFSYDTYSRREAPVNPKIQRVRTDMSWEDVVNSTGNDHKSGMSRREEDLE